MLNSNLFSLLNISLIATLIIINAVWVYTSVVYTKVYRNSPKITNHQKSTSLLPSPSNIGARSKETSLHFSYKHEINLPFVSIIIPARNEESEISRCLTSLLNQEYPNFEIVAIDDNSSDNTLQVMQKIRTEYCQSINLRAENKPLDLQQSVNELQSNSSPTTINNLSSEIRERQKDNLILTVSLQSPMYANTNSSNNYEKEKLKIISLKDKPENWAAKTWASQQGFLHSIGDIIIFTDADTCYVDKSAILAAISYLLEENLDILTGFPFIELRDFWSKAISPIWRLIDTVFGANLTDINDPKSDAANLNGCFIAIRRKAFQDLGTYQTVRNSIREDEALGMRAKQSGYKIRGICMEDSLIALWSRDFRTLWWGIARTIIPIFMDKRRRTKIVINILMVFLMGTLPFMILPYSLSISEHFSNSIISQFGFNINRSNVSQHLPDSQAHLTSLILLLNLSACFMLFVGSAAIARREFKISSLYASIAPLSAAFIVVAVITHVISLAIVHNKKGKIVEWHGRKFVFHQK